MNAKRVSTAAVVLGVLLFVVGEIAPTGPYGGSPLGPLAGLVSFWWLFVGGGGGLYLYDRYGGGLSRARNAAGLRRQDVLASTN